MKYLRATLRWLSSSVAAVSPLQPGGLTRRAVIVISLSIFFAAAGVRLLQWQNNWLTLDETMWRLTERYKGEAQFLLSGDLASFVSGPSAEPDTGILIHTPGYPVLIALVHKASGGSDAALRLLQLILDSGAAVLVFLLAAELLPGRAAAIAGLLAAFSPQLSFRSLLLLPDSLSGLPILLALYLIVRAARRPRLAAFIAAGAAIGVSCWLRANALLLAPFLCLLVLALFWRGRPWRYAAAMLGTALLVIAPITIRNAIVFRSFIPLSLGTGLNLVEGIADYDPERRFGFEAYDHLVSQQEARLYSRPDYAEDLYRPDGMVRERLRLARAWAVIRSNKLWFMGVMLRRAAFMLEYEQVPVVSVEPSVSNSVEVTNETELVWSADLSGQGEQFAYAPIGIQKKTDYLLRLSLKVERGGAVVKVLTADDSTVLASAPVPDSADSAADIRLPFVSGGADQIRITVENAGTGAAVQLNRAELFRLGPASYLWTRYPRALVKVIQKSFRTERMLPLVLAGIVLLALARRWAALAVALAVPVYYLCVHSPLHVEPRYVLAMHYFFPLLIAAALYWLGAAALATARRVMALRRA